MTTPTPPEGYAGPLKDILGNPVFSPVAGKQEAHPANETEQNLRCVIADLTNEAKELRSDLSTLRATNAALTNRSDCTENENNKLRAELARVKEEAKAQRDAFCAALNFRPSVSDEMLLAEARALRPAMVEARQKAKAMESDNAWLRYEIADQPGFVAKVAAKLKEVRAQLAESERRREDAIHERESCHQIYDRILELCGYAEGQCYPGLQGAVEKVITERDAAQSALSALQGKVEMIADPKNYQHPGPFFFASGVIEFAKSALPPKDAN